MLKNTKITEAIHILKKGGVVIFPTETVYGLGARLSDLKGLQKIYQIKQRPSDNPLIVHIAKYQQLKKITSYISPAAHQLTKHFWPGPLTLIFNKTDQVPDEATAKLKTVAVRMPSHPIAKKLIQKLNEPIAAPSANRSSRPSPTRFQDVFAELGSQVKCILDGGEASIGLESTVVDTTSTPFKILRPGSISLKDLKKIVPDIEPFTRRNPQGPALSPGLKHLHYRPNCKVQIVQSKKLKDVLNKLLKKKLKVGLITLSQKIGPHPHIVFYRYLNHQKNKFAKNLYSNFYAAERAEAQILLVESTDLDGIGCAIMDRLSRASGKK